MVFCHTDATKSISCIKAKPAERYCEGLACCRGCNTCCHSLFRFCADELCLTSRCYVLAVFLDKFIVWGVIDRQQLHQRRLFNTVGHRFVTVKAISSCSICSLSLYSPSMDSGNFIVIALVGHSLHRLRTCKIIVKLYFAQSGPQRIAPSGNTTATLAGSCIFQVGMGI